MGGARQPRGGVAAQANGRALLDAASRALTALGFRVNPAHGVGLGAVSKLIERGHAGRQLVGALAEWEPGLEDRHRLRMVVADALTDLAGSGLVELCRAKWRLSWSGPYFLADLEGRESDLRLHTEAASTDPAAVPHLASFLAAQGLRLDYAPPVAAGPPEPQDQVLG